MPLSTDKIPNQPLNGVEVMEYSLALIREYCEQFKAYPFRLRLRFTMKNPTLPTYTVFAGRFPNNTPDTPQVALEGLISEARSFMKGDYVFSRGFVYPNIAFHIHLELLTPDGHTAIRTLEGTVDNPNLVRVHYRLPIVQVEKILPTEDAPFGGIRNVTMDIDPSIYPKPKAPTVTDETPDVELLPIEAKPIMPNMLSPETVGEPEESAVVDEAPRTRRKRA